MGLYKKYKNMRSNVRKALEEEEEKRLGVANNLETSTPQTNVNNYTLNDLIKANQPTDVKSPYEQRMDEYTDIYNKQVEANNQNAANQSAIAYAQMQEINKNANELNKASGKQNTGYAGDISIDSYNAYRNSVNEAQKQANASNNDLFNYYLQNMTALQQQKDSQEMAREQMDYEKIYGERGVLNTIATGDDAYYENGKIKEENAKELWDYITTLYGGAGNIPKDVAASLNSTKGFNEWLEAYNSGNEQAYANNNKGTFDIETYGDVNYAVINADATAGSQIRDVRFNNFKIDYKGNKYSVETGDRADTKTSITVKNLIKNKKGRDVQEGDLLYYNGNIYVVSKGEGVYKVQARSGMNSKDDFDALKKAMGI